MRCNTNAKAERQGGGGGLPCCKEIAVAKNLATDVGSPQPCADDRAYSQGSLQCNTGNCVVVSLSAMCSWLRPANITSQPYKRGRTQQVVGVLTYLKTGLTTKTSEFIESEAESINMLEEEKKKKKNNGVARQIQSRHTFQLLRETQRTAKPCAPPVTSLRCQILACSDEQSAQLLHQRVYAPVAPLAGPPTPLQGHKSNQCSKCKRGSQSQTPSHSEVGSKCQSRETTCEWKCNIAVARLFSSDTTTLQSPRLSRLSRPCLVDSPSNPKKS